MVVMTAPLYSSLLDNYWVGVECQRRCETSYQTLDMKRLS